MYYSVYEQFVSVAAFIQYMLTCLSLNFHLPNIILKVLMKGVDKYLLKFINDTIIYLIYYLFKGKLSYLIKVAYFFQCTYTTYTTIYIYFLFIKFYLKHNGHFS